MKIPAKFADINVLYKAYLAERKNSREVAKTLNAKIEDLKFQVAELKVKTDPARPSGTYYYVSADGNIEYVDAKDVFKLNGKCYTKLNIRKRHNYWDGRGGYGTYYTKHTKRVEVFKDKN